MDAMRGRSVWALVFLSTSFVGWEAEAQAPSGEEQQYLFSVLPLIDKGQLAVAEEKLVEGRKLYPRSAIIQNALGIVYLKQNKMEAAVAAFRQALQILPTFTAAQLHLASIYQQQGNKKEAAELLAAVGKTTPDFDALVTAGLGLAQCEDYPNAIQVLEKARFLRPESASVAYNLALARYRKGEFQSALDTLGSIQSSDETQKADVLFLRGKLKKGLNQTGGSEDLAQACRLEPSSETYCVDAGLALMKEERLQEAEQALQGGLGKSSSSLPLRSTLGLVQFRLGKYSEAIESYTQVLEKDPAGDASREGLAFLLYLTGELEKARNVVEKGLKNETSDFYLSQLHAMILYRLSPQLWREAISSINRALEKKPGFAPAYFLRGKIEMDNCQLEAALQDFQKAAELDGKYPLPYYKIAQIYIRQGRLQEAEVARQKFSELGNLREEELLTKQTQDLLMQVVR